MKLTPHFTFDGQSEEALNFYSKVFNGNIVSLIRFSDMEGGCCGATELRPGDERRLLNGCLQFDGNELSFCDQMPGQSPVVGNNVMLDITLSDEVELRRVFDALCQGGKILVPLAPQSWTALYGLVADRYGICWNVMQQWG